MANMKSDTLLDYAVFQLSPKRSRCELFVSSDGSTEKLASGLLKPFISHLQIAEEQVASGAQSIKLDVGRCNKAETWFTKGTLERFVRFVSTPEVLELVNTLDGEMSQLEAARRIYSQGAGGQLFGGGGFGVTSGDDATKKELLRAMDVRLVAVLQDLSTACARAAAAGFNIDTVSELQMFADKFGAHRLNEACAKFISLNERRPELTQPWRSGPDDRAVRSSYGSDMSIDDDPPSPPPRQQPATFHHPDPPASTSVEAGNKPVDAVSEKVKKEEGSTPDQTGSIQASQPGRRLSVQDRINMFENKQKENSGGKPVVVAKPVELRRISSDLSAASGAAALRRWSGASDMSIDLSSDKRGTESPTCPPVSTAFAQEKKVSNVNDGAAEISSKIIPGTDRGGDNRLKGASFNNSDQSFESNSNSSSGERDVLKDQVGGVTQSRSLERPEDQESSEGSFNTLAGGKIEGLAGFGDQGKLKGYLSGEETQMTGVKNQVSSTTHDRSFLSEGDEKIETANRREGSESRDERVKEIRVKATQKTAVESGVIEGGPGSRILKAFASRYKVIEGDSSSNQKEVRSVGETEVSEKKESHLSENDVSGPQRLKFNRQRLAAELSKKTLVQREKISSSGNIGPQLSGKVEAHECVDSFSTPPPEANRVRQSKGNQELNNNLKTKAGELEKLFAEHKLRVPGENSNSARKGRLGDAKLEASSSLRYTKPVADIDGQYDGDAISGKFSDLSVSEGSRGKLYDRYMQIRDEKLREDWSANRGEKEAKLKHLQDSLERNRSEMKAKFSGSADRPDPVSSAHRRAEQIRSYNSRPIMKREQPGLNFGDSEDDEETLDFPAQNRIHEILSGEVSRGSQGKKHLPNNKKLSTPPTLAAPVPRSGMKTSASGKRIMIPDNPLAQSVPNLLDMRKESTKPSSGSNKATRSQVKSIARSKSISDEAAVVREDKSRRSQSLRKSSVNSSDFRQISLEESDGACLAPLNFDDEILKNAVTKPFLKKGSRTSFVARTTIAGEKVSGVSELIKPEEENCDMESAPDEFVITGKDEDEEEFESLNSEGHNSLHNGETKQGLEQEKFTNSGSEDGDGALTFSLVDQALGSNLPIESMPDWSGESPVSWNSHTQHPFSYPHEMSDVDASVYSPVGSPESCNSHSVNQIETDSSWMRKKWGTTQKPMLAVHSSNNPSRNDVTRGFKRLLKFGRKSRGSESLVDWISATTSEGDDDTEDGRDPSNRLSDDLRKSRMGSSHTQASEDSFNGREFFNGSVQSSQNSIPAPQANFRLREDNISGSSIKASRSFFSLSAFRSKGSDPKIR